MSARTIFVICAQVLLCSERALTQCITRGPYFGSNHGVIRPRLADAGLSFAKRPYRPIIIDISASNGRRLPISSFSVQPPSGLHVASDNLCEGTLSAAGELPFAGTAAVNSVLPTTGTCTVNYDCGNDVTESIADVFPAAVPTASIAAVAPSAITVAIPASYFGYAAILGCNC